MKLVRSLLLISLIGLSIGAGYFIWTHGTYRTIVIYWLYDAINAPKADNLMLGSSSIRRADSKMLSRCGSWLNRGVGASTIKQLSMYLDYTLLAMSPKRVLIYAGENDVSQSNQDAEAVLTNYRKLLSMIEKKYPLAEVHILAIKPSPARALDWEVFSAINNQIKWSEKRGARWKVHYGDWQQYSTSIPSLFLSDGVHLTTTGYEVFLSEFVSTCRI